MSDEVTKPGWFEIRDVKAHQLRRKVKGTMYFVVVGANGEDVSTSETYNSYSACMKGIESVRRTALNVGVRDRRRMGGR